MTTSLDNTTVRIEASTVCQLKCPLCPTANGYTKNGAAGWGTLSLPQFEQLLEHLPKVKKIEFSNYGEVFLNKDFTKILTMCHQKGIVPYLINGVNLNTATDAQLEALVLYNVETMTVSIDGATQKVYEQYRVNGNLASVINNIKKINQYKADQRKSTPALIWQFVVFEHNIHELDAAYHLSKSLGMVFHPKVDWTGKHSAHKYLAKIKDYSQKMQEVLIEDDHQKCHGVNSFCFQLWSSPQINWNGKILGCCINFWDDFGTLGEDLRKLEDAKNMLLGIKPLKRSLLCTHCSVFYRHVLSRIYWKNLFNIDLYKILVVRIDPPAMILELIQRFALKIRRT